MGEFWPIVGLENIKSIWQHWLDTILVCYLTKQCRQPQHIHWWGVLEFSLCAPVWSSGLQLWAYDISSVICLQTCFPAGERLNLMSVINRFVGRFKFCKICRCLFLTSRFLIIYKLISTCCLAGFVQTHFQRGCRCFVHLKKKDFWLYSVKTRSCKQSM